MTVVVVDPNADQLHFAPGHPENPSRTAAIRALVVGLDGVEVIGCEPASVEEISAVHDPAHVAAVRRLCERGGGWFDADTYCTADSFEIARLAAGAAIRATDVAVGDGRHAFALTRPPGHHATRTRAMGFCLFNNVVIAARHAQKRLEVQRIAIVDIDVHHGNGTEDLVDGDASILYCSLHQWPLYPGTGAPDSSHANIVDVALAPGTDDARWIERFDAQVVAAISAFAPELLMVSAGFDALATDPLAGLSLTSGTYSSVASRLVDISSTATVWCLEGGYDTNAMPQAVRGILETLRDHSRHQAVG